MQDKDNTTHFGFKEIPTDQKVDAVAQVFHSVAISEVTTDYWQGDEAKFLNMYHQDDDYYIDTVEFDESTKHFQVQFSVPIFDQKNQHMGVLILGVDVEKALSK